MDKDKKGSNSSSSDETIRVAVRIRPLIESEVIRGCQCILNKTKDVPQVYIASNGPKSEMFTFNYAFSPDDSNYTLYREAVKPIIGKLLKGYNVTILAYGQTGSGKTHTMGTSYNSDSTDDSAGVIPSAINEIFDQIRSMNDEFDIRITCSFMELYQEQLFDLLSTNERREDTVLDIREDSNKGIIIPNLREVRAKNCQEALECLVKGSSGRSVGKTAMNNSSSRSHAIFTVNVYMTPVNDANSSTTAKFHLVDLAGSERPKKTQATGERFREGVKINQGLLALGNVISALGSNQTQNTHISYRDSKLTRLLQDSLGGNSVTLMIACVSPADYNLDETLSTLRYADRAKQIKNKPIINQDPKTAEINRLNNIIQHLRMELLNQNVSTDLNDCEMITFTPKRRKQLAAAAAATSIGGATYLNGGGNVDSEELIKLKKELESANLFIRKLKSEGSEMAKNFELTLFEMTNMNVKLHSLELTNEELLQKMETIKGKIIDLNATFSAESCPAEFVLQGRAVNELKQLIFEASDYVKDNAIDMNYCDVGSGGGGCGDDGVGGCNGDVDEDDNKKLANGDDDHQEIDDNEEVTQQVNEFRLQQIQHQGLVRDMSKQLSSKIELFQRMNHNLLLDKDTDNLSKITECEEKIRQLELERDELKKSREKNVSSKLAEERRQKINSLESDIMEMKKQMKNQSFLLKERERTRERVKQMEKEIIQMKQAKVKLIRQMKSENEDFRRWKQNLNKEVTQLKQKDRRRENEIRQKEILHEKQRLVLKRKMDEALMVNKRLKDVLDKQKKTQAQRNRNPIKSSSGGKLETIQNYLDEEIEVLYSLVDAKHSLKQLMDDRAEMNVRLVNMKRIKKPTANEIQLIDHLNEDIQMRNAQISDLQDKIKSTDLDEKMKIISDGLSNIPDARTTVKYLLNNLTDLRTEFDKNLTKFNDVRIAYAEHEDKLLELQTQCAELKRMKTECERGYENKITVLLTELNNVGAGVGSSGNGESPAISEMHKIQEETLTTMRDKIEEYEEQIRDLQDQLNTSKQPKIGRNKRTTILIEEDLVDISSESIDEDDINDPDWKKTPIVRGHRSSNRNQRLQGKKLSTESNGNDESNEAQKSDEKLTSNIIIQPVAVNKKQLFKRNSSNESNRNYCSCKIGCKTKLCGCRKIGLECDTNQCKCSESCQNQSISIVVTSEASSAPDNENLTNNDNSSVTSLSSFATATEGNSLKREALSEIKNELSNKDGDDSSSSSISERKRPRHPFNSPDIFLNDETVPYPFSEKKKRKQFLTDF